MVSGNSPCAKAARCRIRPQRQHRSGSGLAGRIASHSEQGREYCDLGERKGLSLSDIIPTPSASVCLTLLLLIPRPDSTFLPLLLTSSRRSAQS